MAFCVCHGCISPRRHCMRAAKLFLTIGLIFLCLALSALQRGGGFRYRSRERESALYQQRPGHGQLGAAGLCPQRGFNRCRLRPRRHPRRRTVCRPGRGSPAAHPQGLHPGLPHSAARQQRPRRAQGLPRLSRRQAAQPGSDYRTLLSDGRRRQFQRRSGLCHRRRPQR